MTIEAPPPAWEKAVWDEVQEHLPPGWAMVLLTNPDARRSILLLLWTLRPMLFAAETLVPTSKHG